MIGLNTGEAKAEGFNTGYILHEMPTNERTVHIDGTVRGIAYAYYFQNNKDETRFNCALDYSATGDKEKWTNMMAFLSKHPEKPLGGVLFVYLRKKCKL